MVDPVINDVTLQIYHLLLPNLYFGLVYLIIGLLVLVLTVLVWAIVLAPAAL